MADSKILGKLFHLYFLLKRPVTLGVRVLVENENREVLLVRHTYVEGWYLPGGGVETGDTIHDAAQKELREETGLELHGELELFGFYKNISASKRDHVALLKASDFREAEVFRPSREIAEIGFFPLDNLPDGITKGNLQRLREVYFGEPVSHYW